MKQSPLVAVTMPVKIDIVVDLPMVYMDENLYIIISIVISICRPYTYIYICTHIFFDSIYV